jgi:beta-glucosidase
LATRIEPAIDAAALPLPIEVAGVKPLAILWEASLTPPATGDYNLGLKADGFFRIRLDGKDVTSAWDSRRRSQSRPRASRGRETGSVAGGIFAQ